MLAPSRAVVRDLGRADYEPTFAAMRAFTDARSPDTPDELWIVEHPPVFTLGLGADRGHLLAGNGIPPHAVPVIQTDRGGEVTYHGPGQVVIYLLMDLRRNKPGGKLYARQFVAKIEQAIINVLAAYNLAGERIAGAPGIYMACGPHQGAKIAALGLKVRGNGCTYHGVSLNVAMDLAPFSWINPCGYSGLETVDLRTVGVEVALADVQRALAQELIAQLATAGMHTDTTDSTQPPGQAAT
ncbi:lipoyl(octanoyl) transferase LipB [Massilia sp. PAMC28688]|uniref:lipoyl(octanoyl) transferase LipB n=1 Tax=Massilia sp. PAMC28688 TaxID=2861283 RepID=UPI001C637CF8|nr:lipoyl(octanoyl) transferase LipB [Massilia sp. PAMC28688]QYF95257.1 lipoyl(octanoyl) transferase LipB [Massilia sp. PAMC28688]